jgi:hypothetical protein
MFAPLNVLGIPTSPRVGEYNQIGGISPLTRLLNVFTEQSEDPMVEAHKEPVKEPLAETSQTLTVNLSNNAFRSSATTFGIIRGVGNYTFPIYTTSDTGTLWSTSSF